MAKYFNSIFYEDAIPVPPQPQPQGNGTPGNDKINVSMQISKKNFPRVMNIVNQENKSRVVDAKKQEQQTKH